MKHFIDLLTLKESRSQEREAIQRSIELIDKFVLQNNKDKNQTYTTYYYTIV